MKIALLSPAGAMHRYNGSFKKALHYAPLTLTTLASLIPPDIEAEVNIYDETIMKIPTDLNADLIGITAITGTSMRAYKWADYYRKRGIPVVIGGVHATLLPQDVIPHADAVVVGFADKTFPQLLRDFKDGKMKKIYRQEADFSIHGRPIPRRELLGKGKFVSLNSIEATRGCINECKFCAAASAWGKTQFQRPVREVIEEMEPLPGKEVLFVDVNLIADPQYAKKLFTEMIPLKRIWFGLVTSHVTKDKELFDLIVKSGCKGLLIGFESFVEGSLDDMRKSFNNIREYKILIDTLHDKGIIINGTFAFGSDGENKDVFKKTVEMVIQLKIDLPRFAVMTPFPGTPYYKEMNEQNRIIERDWSLYDVEHCVIKPQNMSSQELEEGLEWAWKNTYTLSSIIQRISSTKTMLLVSMGTNIGYRIYADRFHSFTKERMCDLSDIPSYTRLTSK